MIWLLLMVIGIVLLAVGTVANMHILTKQLFTTVGSVLVIIGLCMFIVLLLGSGVITNA